MRNASRTLWLLNIILLLLAVPLVSAGPVKKVYVDTQFPDQRWRVRYLYPGTTPRIQVVLLEDNSAYTNLTGWGGTFHIYTNNTDSTTWNWTNVSVVATNGTMEFLLSPFNIPVDGSTQTYEAEFRFTNSTDTVVWGAQGEVILRDAPSAGVLSTNDLTASIDFDNFTETGALDATVDVMLDASGYDGNLTTDDDTLAEVAQALDDLNVAGGITGPGSSTDNALVRWDGAGGDTLQDSAVTVDDSGNIATSGTVDGRDVSADGTTLDAMNALTTKGDLLLHTGAAYARQAVGSDGDLLKAASGEANGVVWYTPFPNVLAIAITDETSDIETGTANATFRMPFAFDVDEARISLTTAPVGSVLQVDVNEGGVSIFSTVLSIDVSEKTSTTATTPAVIDDATLADDAEITVDVDQVGSSTAGAGLKLYLIDNPE